MRKLIYGLLGVFLLLAVLLITGVAYLRTARPEREGTLVVPGLEAPVDVLWTERAVPHIRAGSLHDAVFAQGFLHARDRLWQMELVRRAVQGRLSEVMGEATLETDRFMRRLGLWNAARDSRALLDERETALLQAYADGVNAAIDSWSGALPPEFLALRFTPEPWEPAHTLAVAKMMSLTLAAYGESVAVARALRRLPRDRVRWLFPEFPEWGTTILPPEPPPTPPLAAALIDRYSVAAASNSWVVVGSMTRSGRPILANDMHLELQAPALWYLVGLHAPAASAGGAALDVVGVSIPGAPLVITGRNRAIAWGMTNAFVDDVDVFMERVDTSDPDLYLTPDGSRPFEVVAESIRVKGRERPAVLRVRRTRHGPLLTDTVAAGDTVLAVQWTAFEPTTVFRGVLGFNLARSWDEFVAAIDAMDDPHQNMVYADTAGHIGYVMGGTVPLRGDRRPAPVAPRPGWTGEWDWSGELPFEEHPRSFDPAAGFVVTANNRQTAEPVSDLISRSWLQPFRAMRISELIGEGERPYDTDAILRMQMDVVDLYAERYADRAMEAARGAGLDPVAATLEGWDHRAGPGSRAATLFYAWNEIVRRELGRDLYRGDAPYFTREAVGAVLDRRAVPWAEDPEATYRRIAEEAMRRAADRADGRRWGEVNRAIHSHALGTVSVLDRLLGLDIGPAPHYGSPTTVNVAHWALQSPDDRFPFLTTVGPSMRQVIDLGNKDGAGGFVIPTGQSGLPFSRHYDDQTELWRWGGLLALPLDGDAVERVAQGRLRLDPGGG